MMLDYTILMLILVVIVVVVAITISIPNMHKYLEIHTPSASGKTLVVASSWGNAVTTAEVKGKPVTIELNAYIKP